MRSLFDALITFWLNLGLEDLHKIIAASKGIIDEGMDGLICSGNASNSHSVGEHRLGFSNSKTTKSLNSKADEWP